MAIDPRNEKAMTDSNSKPAFEPVLLDLSHDDDYVVIIQALEEYEGVMQGEADDERERIRHNNLPESDSDEKRLQSLADRAARMRLNIEEQLEANDAARSTN